MKRVSYTLAFVLGAFATFSSAAQIQGFITGYAPSLVDEFKEVKGVEKYTELHSDFMWSLGGEFLVNPVGPLMVGGGIGFFSVQQDGDVNVVMPSVPLWGTVGVIGPETWCARPYLEFRVGYPIPAARFATWWDKPLNFFATGAIGVQLPYHMGVEFDYTYITMDKYFKKHDINFRLGSAKFGGSITVHFDLFKSPAEPSEASAKKNELVAPLAAEESSSGETSSDVSENTESTATEETSYSDYSEQPAEESVTEYVAEETSEEQSSEEAAESTAEEETSYAEESAAEEATAEAVPEEEVVTEEAPAEEPVAEPAPEPKPEPVAAKKDKKSAKNAKAKKGSKKSAKKAGAKKSSKKGKAASKKSTKKSAAKKKQGAAKKKPLT